MFKDIRPATSLLEVSKLIDDDALIEIEADAMIPGLIDPTAVRGISLLPQSVTAALLGAMISRMVSWTFSG